MAITPSRGSTTADIASLPLSFRGGRERGSPHLEGEPAGGRACLERSVDLERGLGVGTSTFRRGEQPGCGPGAALKAEGAATREVRLLCSPSLWKMNRPGAGPVSNAVRTSTRGEGVGTSVFRLGISRLEADSARCRARLLPGACLRAWCSTHPASAGGPW